MDRRKFISKTGTATMGAMLLNPVTANSGNLNINKNKTKIAVVGTGVRGVGTYGRTLLRDYSSYVEMVGLCDTNPGRLKYAKEYIGVKCPTFTDLDEMITKQKPETLIVTTEDSVHHKVIIRGLELGCNIITEKPLTIDEVKAQAIIDAEKKSGKKVIVTFNYRYPTYRAKIKQLLMDGIIGDIKSIDFHWNLSHSHLTAYMQRWHGEVNRGGSLWVHKATHHFDMVNWFIDSDPMEVVAFGALEHFGHNNSFRGSNCRNCAHTANCKYYWDITKNDHLRKLYTENEHYDGYIRDNCVFRKAINIFDKHSAIVKYANGAYMNYSLTGNTDYDGYWLAFNGSKGRLETRVEGFPVKEYVDLVFTPIGIHSDKSPEVIRIKKPDTAAHWGGDTIMLDKLFKDPTIPDPLKQQAGVRDGVMSIIIGIAARKSIASGKPVSIKGLTEIEPMAKRPV